MPTNEVMILGGGLDRQQGQLISLSRHSMERTSRFLRYYHENRRAFDSATAFALCSGGYALLADRTEAPDDGSREAVLMADELMHGCVPASKIRIEDESYSTVTNFTYSIKKGLLSVGDYQNDHQLGVVTHPDHFRRVSDFTHRLAIPQSHIEPILSESELGGRERALRYLYRGALLGAVGVEAVERREWLLSQLLDTISPAKQI